MVDYPNPQFDTLNLSGNLVEAGAITVGSPAPTSMGACTINALNGIYVNGTSVSTITPATSTTIGGIIAPTAGGLVIGMGGSLSVNWASPGAIGSGTAAAGAFTTLTASSSLQASQLKIGNPMGGTGGWEGPGLINCEGIYVNGTAVVSGSGGIGSVTSVDLTVSPSPAGQAIFSATGGPITHLNWYNHCNIYYAGCQYIFCRTYYCRNTGFSCHSGR